MSDSNIQHLVEAALYVDDLDRAEAFYQDVLGLELIGKEPERHVFFRAGEGVLLIFNPESTQKQGLFPSHGTKGAGHAALGVAADSFDIWRSRLEEHGIQIEKEAAWPRGGRSLYFRDPQAIRWNWSLRAVGVWRPAGDAAQETTRAILFF